MKAINTKTESMHKVVAIDLEKQEVRLHSNEHGYTIEALNDVVLIDYSDFHRFTKERKYPKGEWKITSFWNRKILPAIGITTELGNIYMNYSSWENHKEEAEDIAKLISQAPNLLQFTEMFVDHLKSNGMKDTLPCKLALETLSKL